MSEQREERFYVRGSTSFETFKAFRAALEKMAGGRLAESWYDDDAHEKFFGEIDNRHAEDKENG